MLKAMDLKGKTALVTGGGRRLGKEIALALAREGSDIILHYHHSQLEAEKVSEKIMAMGRRCTISRQDLSDPKGTEEWIDELLKNHQPEILVNSASVYSENTYRNLDAQVLADSMNLHVHSPLIMIRRMYELGIRGRIVNILDTRIADRDRIHAAYHLGKRGLFTITRDLAREFAPELRINGVAPGIILPPEGKDEKWMERLKTSNPLVSYGSPADVCDAVLFLISAEFITGQIIFVDGGRNLKGNAYGL